jgi:hypothetical protein
VCPTLDVTIKVQELAAVTIYHPEEEEPFNLQQHPMKV